MLFFVRFKIKSFGGYFYIYRVCRLFIKQIRSISKRYDIY